MPQGLEIKLDMYQEDIQDTYKNKKEAEEFVLQQENILRRASSRALTDSDFENYIFTKDDLKQVEKFQEMAKGNVPRDFNLKDYLSTPQAQILVPKIVVGTARRAAEPVYLASKFYRKIKINNSNVIKLTPVIGTMQAHEYEEGVPVPEEQLETHMLQSEEYIRTTKKGVKVSVTDDYIKNSQWNLVTYILEEAGFALARLKEELACREFSQRGWPVFDNSLRLNTPEAGTTGLNKDGAYNDTMSIEDFMDMILALMFNEKTPTDVLMHPLTWVVFARNHLTGALTGPTDKTAKITTPNASFPLGPSAVQGRLPFGLNINLSPWVKFDKVNKRFDLYCLDARKVGLLIQEEDITLDKWRDIDLEINKFRYKEKYAYGTFDEGRGITVAKNISMDKSYPEMDRVLTYTP